MTTKIAIAEALIIIGLLVYIFWPSEQISNEEHQRLKIRLSEERSTLKRYQDSIRGKIMLDSAEYKRLDKRDNDLINQNENKQTGIDVAVIRSVGVDTLIRTDEAWPEGY